MLNFFDGVIVIIRWDGIVFKYKLFVLKEYCLVGILNVLILDF